MTAPEESIQLVRRFNRFYTRRIGLQREGLLATPFSLTQARVLYEIARHPGTRSAALAADLGLDPAYLSRLLTTFQRRNLLTRAQSSQDRRVQHLRLTRQGRAAFARMDALSRRQSAGLLEALDADGRQRLTSSMTAIEELLGPPSPQPPSLTIRPHRPGDIGWVIARHGELYHQEYGWDCSFEGLVAEIAGRFLTHFDPLRERCWIAELNGRRAGCVFLVKHTARIARLRLLLVEPSARGHSLGTRLVDECISFARQAGYRKLTLWTNDVLHAARRIYQRAGFRLVRQNPHHSFGHQLVGQFWDLAL